MPSFKPMMENIFKKAMILYKDLPKTLPPEEIMKYNIPKMDININREYTYRSLCFLIPPKVFFPSKASEIIFDYLFKDKIKINGKNCCIMGCGAGVEVIIVALKGAKSIYAVDINPAAVEATKHNYQNCGGIKTKSKFYPIVSDLFNFMKRNFRVKFDLIIFNPPAVSIKCSKNKDIIRNACQGSNILYRFFLQIKKKRILSYRGRIYVILSNTSELKKIIYNTILLGFIPKIVAYKEYEILKMYLFEFSFFPNRNLELKNG